MANCLYECLREARLERYYPNFESQGLTMSEGLSELTMQDYSKFGVEDMHDRKRLFQLIQVIKMVQDEGKRCNMSCSKPTPPSSPEKPTTASATITSTPGRADNVTSSSSAYFGDASENLNNSTVLAWQNYHSALQSRTSAANQSRFFTEQNEALGLNDSRNFVVNRSNNDNVSPSENKENVDGNERDATPAAESMPTFTPPRPRQPYLEKVQHDSGYDYGVPAQAQVRSPKRSLSYGSEDGGERIRVCVRKRPMNKREKKAGQADIVQVQGKKTVLVNEAKVAVDLTKYTQQHEFIFDEAFGEECSNEEVHQRTAKPLVSWALRGNKSTCFAYGQTGAGKTHTMMGKRGVKGLYLLAAQDLFEQLKSGEHGIAGQQVYISFYEIYCGQLFDLLHGRKRLYARENASHRVCISGLLEIPITNVSELMEIIAYGNTVRRSGSTKVNLDSSRSHAVLQIQLKDSRERDRGRISFIDLAGSERLCEANFLASKQNRHEGAEINQSLLALKECIRALDQEQQHTPFRQSKLTQVLKDSFIGNSRTCMIANISPGNVAADNTLNTLRYADRVKELRKDSPSHPRQTAGGSPMRTRTPGSPRLPGSPGNRGTSSAKQPRRLTGSGSQDRRATPCVFHPSNVPLSSTPKGKDSPRHAGTGSRVNSVMRAEYGLYSTTPVKGFVKPDSGKRKRGARRILAGARSESEASPANQSQSSPLDRQGGSEGRANKQAAAHFSPLKPGVHLVRDAWVGSGGAWEAVREPAVAAQVAEQPAVWEEVGEAGSDTDGPGEGTDADREYPEGCSDSSRDTLPNSTQTSDLDSGQEMVSHLDSVLGLNHTASRSATSPAAIGPPAFKKTKVIQTEKRPSKRSSYFPPLRDEDEEEDSTTNSDNSEHVHDVQAANKGPPSNKQAAEDGVRPQDIANSHVETGDQNGASSSASQRTPSANTKGPSALATNMTTANASKATPSGMMNTPVSAAKMTGSKSPTKTPASAVVKEIMSLPSPRDFLGSSREPKNWTIFSDEEATPARGKQEDAGESLRRSLSAPELNECIQNEDKTNQDAADSPMQAGSDADVTEGNIEDTRGKNELETSKPVSTAKLPATGSTSTVATSDPTTDHQLTNAGVPTLAADTRGTPDRNGVTVSTSASSVRLAAVFSSPATEDTLPAQGEGTPPVPTSGGEQSPARRREDHLQKARSLFLEAHRDQLKDMRKWCEEEEALSSVAQQDFDSYVCRLDSILSRKLEDIVSLRARLQNYKQDRPLV
ncbi:PREDICTED: kinesin-like protein KIF24 [Branchiostoma belcheri]|uniref:Kinesin-like protein KIF24 n=1 Tax=Branchiostoma belcheri TaxID=7741 RepID=A0A6P5AF78_BRABE|nr:PREDICTED: kinesin-like protein KIF24 [Branchiostoma belcheri]